MRAFNANSAAHSTLSTPPAILAAIIHSRTVMGYAQEKSRARRQESLRNPCRNKGFQPFNIRRQSVEALRQAFDVLVTGRALRILPQCFADGFLELGGARGFPAHQRGACFAVLQ